VNGGTVAATTGGGVTVAGTATARTFTGTLTSLNAYFTASPERITYIPAANSTGSRTLTTTVAESNGAGILSSSNTSMITITAVNDAPAVGVRLDQDRHHVRQRCADDRSGGGPRWRHGRHPLRNHVRNAAFHAQCCRRRDGLAVACDPGSQFGHAAEVEWDRVGDGIDGRNGGGGTAKPVGRPEAPLAASRRSLRRPGGVQGQGIERQGHLGRDGAGHHPTGTLTPPCAADTPVDRYVRIEQSGLLERSYEAGPATASSWPSSTPGVIRFG
jgi:hypothetical protein